MQAGSRAELYAARKRDEGENVAIETACCKLFAFEMCGRWLR